MNQGPVDTTLSPYARRRTLSLCDVSFNGGFWSRWQSTNHNVSLRHGYEQLERFGNFHNLKLAAGAADGEYHKPVFMDSDIYKWLEAVAYELACRPDAGLAE